MGIKNEYGEFETKLAAYSNALAHPSRIAIVMAVYRHNNFVQGKIVEVDGLTNVQVKKHLVHLHKAGIISGRIYGTHPFYSVNISVVFEYLSLIVKLKEQVDLRS